MRIEAGESHISPDDLRTWGLAGKVAWSILTYSETYCLNKEARLKLLKAVADDIIEEVQDRKS